MEDLLMAKIIKLEEGHNPNNVITTAELMKGHNPGNAVQLHNQINQGSQSQGGQSSSKPPAAPSDKK
jgi:hypothetical protein